VKWAAVKAGDVFRANTPLVKTRDDLWVVISVSPSEEYGDFVVIHYAYLHSLDSKDAVTSFHVDVKAFVDYELVS
jgi:hypothetical protein